MTYTMRLLHVIGSMDPLTGGPCQGIRSVSAISQELGVYREVVCFDEPDAAYLGMDPFPVHTLGKGRTSWQYNAKFIPWLHTNLYRFDVVVTNGLWLYHASALRRVIKEMKRMERPENFTGSIAPKWFVMTHGMLDPYFQNASSRRIKAIRNWAYWKLIEHKVVRETDGLLFTCETELLVARETFKPYRPQREINVGYGIETPPAYTNAMKQAFLEKCPDIVNEPFILFLSRVHPKKGVDLLLKAYISLLKEVGHSQPPLPRLVIAGPGMDSDFGQAMQEIARQESAISSTVYFTGMLTGEAKWGAFYGCEAFILPSHQENFGVAVAEALACSKPVLISNQINIWREIEADKGGFIADNTLEGTRHLLKQWLALTADDRNVMSEMAFSTFEQHFAVEPAAKKFKDAVSA